MVRNPRKKSTSDPDTKATAGTESQFSGSVHDSARQIWQAGLGAFTRAQADGSKAFEALAQEGVSIQRKTQAAAEEQLAQASSRMSSMANDISNKASGQWDKLESIFEDRVAKALGKLGIPSARDVQALIDRIDQLHAAVQQISPQTPVSKVARQPASKAAATGKAKAKTSAKKSLPKA
ncbi:MAG: phasin family protein [Rhodoferax sp.]|nr:phasin family protein [Rhodoferax sp.]